MSVSKKEIREYILFLEGKLNKNIVSKKMVKRRIDILKRCLTEELICHSIKEWHIKKRR